MPGSSSVGRANHAVSGSRLSDEANRRRTVSNAAVTVDDADRAARRAGLDAEAGEPVEASAWPATSVRWRPTEKSTTRTRSRVDGTAQITSAAIARYENTSTRAESSIATWKQMATHTAA